jgi:hypothetical protein
MKKRILVLLSAVALMVVMLAMSGAPAFGAKAWHCVNLTIPDGQLAFSKAEKEEWEALGYDCTKIKVIKPPK